MKYSHAVVVACVGGAAFVAALPTDGSHHAKTGMKATRYGKKAGKILNAASAFAKSSLPPAPNTYATPYDVSDSGLRRRTFGTKLISPSLVGKVKSALKHGKTAAHTANRAAGGTTQVAEKLGNVNRLYQSTKQQPDIPVVPDTSYIPRDIEELDARDFDDELFGREPLFDNFRANLARHKANDLKKDAAKAEAVANVLSGSTPSTPAYKRGFTDDLATRDFDFENNLDARDIDELNELEARLFKKFGRVLSAAKDTVLGRKGQATTGSVAPADPSVGAADPNYGMVPRDITEDLDARDFGDDLDIRYFEEHDTRDTIDELELLIREFEDTMEARDFDGLSIDELD